MSDNDNLSQADIDALLSGDSRADASDDTSAGAPEAPGEGTTADGADAEQFDQASIDSLVDQLTDDEAASGDAAAVGASVVSGQDVKGAETFSLPAVEPLTVNSHSGSVHNLDMLKDVSVKVRVELGRGEMYLRDILRLVHGSVVELNKLAGDPLNIYVNERLIAKGEVLVLNENFCIRITEIFSPEDVLKLSV